MGYYLGLDGADTFVVALGSGEDLAVEPVTQLHDEVEDERSRQAEQEDDESPVGLHETYQSRFPWRFRLHGEDQVAAL